MENSGIELLSPNEVVTCLYNKNATQKCRIGLADVVVYEGGIPARWYVTGKTGEIVQKRGTDLNIIGPRWMKVCSQSDSPYVAVMRQDQGVLKFLTPEAWRIFTDENKHDPSIVSLHCFIKGENYIVYRNSFKLKDRLGRFTSSTHSYPLRPKNGADDPVSTLYESQIHLTESRVGQIKNIMDLATNTVIRYLEMMLQIRVHDISIDYVIDKKSQIWMLWTSATKFTQSTLLVDELHLPHGEETVGRMSWAGDKYFEEKKENMTDEERSMEFDSSTIESSWAERSLHTTVESYAPSDNMPPEVTEVQVNSAVNIINISDRAHIKRLKANGNVPTNYAVTVSPTKRPTSDKFPQPFNCRGEYCKQFLEPVGNLKVDTENQKNHVLQKLFSTNELNRLRKDKKFGQIMEYGAAGPALAVISKKSIKLANQEKRGVASTVDLESWNTYPESPREKDIFKMNRKPGEEGLSEQGEIEQVRVRAFPLLLLCVCAALLNYLRRISSLPLLYPPFPSPDRSLYVVFVTFSHCLY